MRQREDGCVYAFSKADGGSYSLRRSEHDSIKTAWMAGKAFWTGVAFYGGEMTIKLGDIVAIEDVAPEHLAAALADKREDAREDAMHT